MGFGILCKDFKKEKSPLRRKFKGGLMAVTLKIRALGD